MGDRLGHSHEALREEMRDPAQQCVTWWAPQKRVHQRAKKWPDLPWQQVREWMQVKLYEHEGELYVLGKSEGRQTKETAIRRKRLGAVGVPFIISSAIAWMRMS